MQELGLKPEENPLINVILGPTLSTLIQAQTEEVIDTSSMSEEEKNAFNNRFLKYEGEIRGTMLKSMFQEVKASNISNENYVEIEGAITEKSELSEISNSDKYDIFFDYDDTGRINKIIVQKIEN